MKTGEGTVGGIEEKDQRSQTEKCTMNRQSQERKEEENDACWRSDRSISPIGGLCLGIGLHTNYLHKETHIGLLIAWDRRISKDSRGLFIKGLVW